MNDLQIFKNESFGEIRTVLIDNEPYFVGKDVAEALGYERETKAIVDHVDEEDRKMLDGKTQSYFGIELGQRGGWLINESGLYSLILSSKLPTAKAFKRWVTSEVLPSIRKNGGYLAGQESDPPEVVIAKALVVAQNVIKENERKIAELTPKADYFDALVDRNLLTNLRDTAKEFGMKQNQFIKWLEKKGFIYRDARNVIKPFSTYITGEKKYFELKEWKTGYTSGTQTLVTPRGREAFRLLLGK